MEIREMNASEAEEAAGVLGRGMQDNPNNVAAWRMDQEPRQQAMVRFFRAVLGGLFVRGCVLGAFDGKRLLGVCAMAAPGQCQPSVGEKLRILPALLLGSKPMVTLRVLKWTGEWGRRDPAEAHWHLGPVAVDLHLQGRGIGPQLMTVFCQKMDEYDARAYLETDKEKNVRFYERYGFRVDAESQVLGVPNWFMMRPSRMAP